jgi:predicted MFS family arabinose efflux permease
MEPKDAKDFRRTLLVPILLLCTFLATSIPFFIGTLLVDVATTFKVSIGTASQLSVITNLMGIITGLAVSSISIKIKHKSLLLMGNAFFAAGTLIYFFAQNFVTVMMVSFLLGAGGSVMVIMVYTLIGDQLPLERRGWALGLTVSSIMAAGLVVSFLSGLIADVAGWRMVLLWFLFPLSVVCLGLSFLVIPSKQPQLQSADKPSYRKVLRRIFLCKSPIACVISTALVAFLGIVPLYMVSFFRLTFNVSPAIGGAILSICTTGGILGGIIGGRLINKYGRKPLTIAAILLSGISTILFTFMPLIELSVVLGLIGGIAMAVIIAGLQSLALEQVPEFRGSMMSIGNSFENIGGILAIIIGGLVLNLYNNNFHLLMTVLGVVGIVAAPVLLLFTKDPTKPSATQ